MLRQALLTAKRTMTQQALDTERNPDNAQASRRARKPQGLVLAILAMLGGYAALRVAPGCSGPPLTLAARAARGLRRPGRRNGSSQPN